MNPKNSPLIIIFIVIYHALLFVYTTPYMTLASLIYGLHVWGLTYRKKDAFKHAKLMTTAIVLDISLVLVLEFLRGAIETTLKFELSLIQQAHIFCSLMAVLLYFPTFYFGRKRLKDRKNPALLQRHKLFAIPAFTFRSLGYFLMFSFLLK